MIGTLKQLSKKSCRMGYLFVQRLTKEASDRIVMPPAVAS